MRLADNATVRSWTGRGFEPATSEVRAVALLVADSWLVVDGAARAEGAHWARFGASCRDLGVGDLDGFRKAVVEAMPSAGRWFPRIELTASLDLRLLVRPSPPPSPGVLRVSVAPPGDPRSRPRRKGPDLDLLVALREQSAADELLLCDGGGALLEGALSSLLWWEEGVLWTTPDEQTLPGITRALIVALAAERGVDVRVRAPLPEQLAGREVWLTSALHGIRAVGSWLSPVQPAGAADRAPEWQAALEVMR